MQRILTFDEMYMLSEKFDISSLLDGEKIKASGKKISEWFRQKYEMDFNSPEAKEKRQNLVKELGSLIRKIVDVLHSGMSKAAKSKTLYKLLDLSVFGALLGGVWSIFFAGEMSLFDPFGNLEVAAGWFQWAGFLYILKVIQGVISGVSGILSTLKVVWDWCKSMISKLEKSDLRNSESRIVKFEQFII